MFEDIRRKADHLDDELNRLTELTERIRADPSIMNREIQEEVIDLLIRTKSCRNLLKVSEIRDEAIRVLTWAYKKIGRVKN